MKIYKAVILTIIFILLLFCIRKVSEVLNVNLTMQMGLNSLMFFIFLFTVYKFNYRELVKSLDFSFSMSGATLLYSLVGISSLYLMSIFFSLMIDRFLVPGSLRFSENPVEWQIIIFSALIWAILEELFFRNFLVRKLNEIYSHRKTIFIGALLFGFSHIGSGNGIIFQFLAGLLLGHIFLKSGKNIMIVILIHIINNVLTFLVVYNETTSKFFHLLSKSFILIGLLISTLLFLSSFGLINKSVK